jgi:hypothetical protein
MSSSKDIAPKNEPSALRWYVKRDASADAALDVTFVRAVINQGPIYAVRFSADGKYLACVLVLLSGQFPQKGKIVIYVVDKGKQTWSVSMNWIELGLSLNSK